MIAREGNINTLTMFNDFEGNASEFGMIIPASSTIDEDNIRLVAPGLIDRLDRYSAPPRLVQYTCEDLFNDEGTTIDPMVISPVLGSSSARARSAAVSEEETSFDTGEGSSSSSSSGCGGGGGYDYDYVTETDTADDRVDTGYGVVIEDEFDLGEYELWVLRADEAEGLVGWLKTTSSSQTERWTCLMSMSATMLAAWHCESTPT